MVLDKSDEPEQCSGREQNATVSRGRSYRQFLLNKLMFPPTKCSQCGGEMTEGFVPSESQSGSGVLAWIAGAPVIGFLGRVKTEGKAAYRIRIFRCAKCGYLESYATDKV